MKKSKGFEGADLLKGQGGDSFTSLGGVSPETVLPGLESNNERPATHEEAREILGDDMFDELEAQKVFNCEITDAPPIPFTPLELIEAKDRGEQLIYFSDKGTFIGVSVTGLYQEPVPLTLQHISMHVSHPTHDKKRRWLSLPDSAIRRFQNAAFYAHQAPRKGWRLVSKEVLVAGPKSDYLFETEQLMTHIVDLFAGGPMPSKYENMHYEYVKERPLLRTMMKTSPIQGARKLAMLGVNLHCRETAVEVAYKLCLNEVLRKKKLHPTSLVATGSFLVRGDPPEHYETVYVGDFTNNGIDIVARANNVKFTRFCGVTFSRGKPD